MKIAALQMVSDTSVSTNLHHAAALVAQAAHQGAELVVLPEYFCLMGHSDRDKLAIAERPDSAAPLQDFLRRTARQHGVWLAGGTVPLAAPTQGYCHNSALVFNPQGEPVARYDKIHLFAFHRGSESYDESATQQPGAHPVAFDLPSRDGHTWRVGLSVCYDLRFPELYRQLAAHLLLVPSAFTHTTGRAHWEILLRARAIENLAYVAAAAQGGHHANGRRTWGHSMVVSPWGDILNQHAAGSAVVMADCDWDDMHERRQQLPALQHRRL